MEAINYWIDRHPYVLNARFSKEFIHLQIKGTAIGTKIAPTNATLVMGYLENKLFERKARVFEDELSTYIY